MLFLLFFPFVFFLFFFVFFHLSSLVIHLALMTNHTHPVVQSANCMSFLFLFFVCLFFLRWFTISTDGGQQNCKLASSRIQNAETRACWQWLVSVYPMSLLIFLIGCVNFSWSANNQTLWYLLKKYTLLSNAGRKTG